MSQKFTVVTSTHEQASVPDELDARSWDIAIVGNPAHDNRSLTACNYANLRSKKVYTLKYDNNSLFIDDQPVSRAKLQILMQGCQSILIEATSLACPELLIALRSAVRENIKAVTFIYLEPVEYRRSLKATLTEHRDFDLSVNSRFKSVHGFMTDLTDTPVGQAVFFLGYEKSRLGQAFEQEETLKQWQKYAVFGVPGYEVGWEIDALANNAHHLAVNDFEIRYVAASSANLAYQLLNELRDDDKTQRPLVVCPLGTKPHAIGAALFLVEHNEGQEATLLFDHPTKSAGRSKEVRRWHLYDVNW